MNIPARIISGVLILAALVPALRAETAFDQAMNGEAAKFEVRLVQAGKELNQTRDRIANEKGPLVSRLRAAQDRILAAEQAVAGLDTQTDQLQSRREALVKQAEVIAQGDAYAAGVAAETLKAVVSDLGAADKTLTTRADQLGRSLAEDRQGKAVVAAQVAEFLEDSLEQSLGGYGAAGAALLPGTNELVEGTFAHLGPDAYFLSRDGVHAGIALGAGENLQYPVVYPLGGWTPQVASALMTGQPASVPADASGGKALRLRETQGTVWDHVQRGGWVAYAIVAVGILSVLLILLKSVDLASLRCADARAVLAFFRVLHGGSEAAQSKLESLASSTRRIFAVGLAHRNEPPEALEERLEAELMQQRLKAERRLPLLAVIATAAPLMGLLGTVVGMVRTFALITVFGTGNAGKLASGISEVLVSTELGLIVAVPTLIAHGFISHRIQNQLAVLERQALEFVTMVRLTANEGLADSIAGSR